MVVWYPYAGFSLHTDTTPPQPHCNVTSTHIEPDTTHEVTQRISRKLLRMDVLTSETCWALNKVILKQVASSWSLFTQPQMSLNTTYEMANWRLVSLRRYFERLCGQQPLDCSSVPFTVQIRTLLPTTELSMSSQHQHWRTYGTRVQNGTRKEIFVTRHSLLSHFFLILLPDWLLYITKKMCIHSRYLTA